MARNSKIFIIIIISCFINFCVSFDAHAKAICKAPVFYKWKHDASYKQENREILKKIPQKLKEEKVRESYWGVIVAEGDKKAIPHKSEFVITVASELMSTACIASDMNDFKKRVNNILIAYTYDNKPIYLRDLKMSNSICLLICM